MKSTGFLLFFGSMVSALSFGCTDPCAGPGYDECRYPDAVKVVGPQGPRGATGTDGRDGDSCSVTTVEQGALIFCEDGTSALVRHGLDGAKGDTGATGTAGPQGPQGPQGLPGRDGTLVWETKILCPGLGDADEPKESVVFVAGLPYGVYAKGQKIFWYGLSFGVDYQSTDGRKCSFRVNRDGTITEL